MGMERALAVKAAVRHAWQNYKQRAWGADEIKPILGTPEGDSGKCFSTAVFSYVVTCVIAFVLCVRTCTHSRLSDGYTVDDGAA